MAAVSNLIDLFRSISAGEVERAREAGEAICRAEEKRGNHVAARRLRGALRPGVGSMLMPQNGATLAPGALTPLVQLIGGLKEVELPVSARHELDEIVLEWNRRDALAKRNIPRRAKLLLHGPPGCGKSLTARALAQELQLPAYVARFDSIIGSYLGQTAVHLRQLFHFTEVVPCVLLLDELDALGKARGNPLDVGELDRIVISLMQELEHCSPLGLVVATTNLPKHLDAALWRRFDVTVNLPQPAKNDLIRYGAGVARRHEVAFSPLMRSRIQRVKSFADAEKLVEAMVRRNVLHGG